MAAREFDAGVPARSPSVVKDKRERVDVVQRSHGDSRTVNTAFAGADTAFWLVPPDPKAESVEDLLKK